MDEPADLIVLTSISRIHASHHIKPGPSRGKEVNRNQRPEATILLTKRSDLYAFESVHCDSPSSRIRLVGVGVLGGRLGSLRRSRFRSTLSRLLSSRGSRGLGGSSGLGIIGVLLQLLHNIDVLPQRVDAGVCQYYMSIRSQDMVGCRARRYLPPSSLETAAQSIVWVASIASKS